MTLMTIIGGSSVIIGILLIFMGGTQFPLNFSNPDFLTYLIGGFILITFGLCLFKQLPGLIKVTSIILTAISIIIYINASEGIDFILKLIAYVPVVALALWLSLKFWN